MSAITLAQQGIEALDKRDYEGALALLDKAINQGTNSPAWLLARAQAHYQLKHYEATLSDAALAYHSAYERANGDTRRHLIAAQYRRSTAYFQLGRYADADCCAKWSMLLAEGRPVSENDGVEKKVDEAGRYTVTYEEVLADKENQPNYGIGGAAGQPAAGVGETGFKREWARAYTWRSQVVARLQALPNDDPGRFVNVAKMPPKPDAKKAEKAEKKVERAPPASTAQPAEKPPVARGSVPDEKLKLRSDFYQSNQDVTVSIFAKNIKKEDLVVEFGENHVGSPFWQGTWLALSNISQVRISPLPREEAPYVKPGDREATSTFILADTIDPSASSWTATPRKVELKLKKAAPGHKWRAWAEEKIGSVDIGATTSTSTSDAQPSAASAAAPAPTPAPAPAPVAAQAPAYPTSSKKGPKNWEKMGEDDVAEDEDAGDVNAFFKKIFKSGTPEQQRAMMKSFTESNGTALSTDWDDVGKRKVETVTDGGFVPKKFES